MTTIDQLLDLHDRARSITEDLRRLSKDARICGVRSAALDRCASDVSYWRKHHVYDINTAMLKEQKHNSREET